MALYKRVDEILFYKWDPIGISDDCPRDEYHHYLPKVFGMLKDGETERTIADYLTLVTTDTMGLRSSKRHDRKVAKLLLIAKKEYIDPDD